MAKQYYKKRILLSNIQSGINCDKPEFSLPENLPTISYNIKTENGALISGNGVEEVVLPASQKFEFLTKTLTYVTGVNIKKMWRYNYYSTTNNRQEYLLVFLGSNNKLYANSVFIALSAVTELSPYVFNEEPTAVSFRINGKDVIGFVSATDSMVIWNCDTTPYQVINIPKCTSLCYHNNRLFAIEANNNNVVRYSSKLNLLDWRVSALETGAGNIDINDYKGKLKNLISLGDYLFIFRDFGISRVNTNTYKASYNAVNVYTTSCKIYCETACVCEDSIYFLCEDGLYAFDGFNVVKKDIGFNNLISVSNQNSAKTCYYNGFLYIACKLNFNDNLQIGVETAEHNNNALIEYNLQTKTCSITRGIDVCCMQAFKELFCSKLLICLNNSNKLWQLTNSACVGSTILPKMWQGAKINFGVFDKFKILKEVNLICKTNCQLIVSSECETKTISIQANPQMQRVRINLKGKNISLAFKSTQSEIYILSAQFIFNVEQ